MTNALDRAVSFFGSQVKLAEALGTRQGTVWHWIHRSRVPAEQAVKIEKATGGAIPRWELRPDLFDKPADRSGEEAA